MKIFITGGTGFIGSKLVSQLLKKKHSVTVYTIDKGVKASKVKIITGDILDYKTLLSAVRGHDAVYHLAGISDIGEAAVEPLLTIQTNIIGSAKVIEACIKANVKRVLFASTVYVYSDKGSFYRVSKQAVELLLESYQETYGLDFTILRYGSLYGPRSQAWNGLKKYISQAVKEKKIEYKGNGEERREYIHAVDAAKLSVLALEKEYANQCLILTGTQVLSSKELLKMINEILGGDIEIKFIQDLKDKNHYSTTPYRFSPRNGRKIVSNEFFDLGQGILEQVEEVYHKNGYDG